MIFDNFLTLKNRLGNNSQHQLYVSVVYSNNVSHLFSKIVFNYELHVDVARNKFEQITYYGEKAPVA